MKLWVSSLFLAILLTACNQGETIDTAVPTRIPLASVPTLASTITPPPTNTAVPTLTSTFSPIPTQPVTTTKTAVPTIIATAIPTPITSPSTPDPYATATPEFYCRPAAELAHVQPSHIVLPGPWPHPPAAGLLGSQVDDGLKLIHLGFDIEGEKFYLDELLDVLDRRQVKTTMFVLGSWAERNPDWVQEFARRGHEMASPWLFAR